MEHYSCHLIFKGTVPQGFLFSLCGSNGAFNSPHQMLPNLVWISIRYWISKYDIPLENAAKISNRDFLVHEKPNSRLH
jgi:hypothetical protein